MEMKIGVKKNIKKEIKKGGRYGDKKTFIENNKKNFSFYKGILSINSNGNLNFFLKSSLNLNEYWFNEYRINNLRSNFNYEKENEEKISNKLETPSFFYRVIGFSRP